ncbi:MAG: histidine kinase [Geobacter sp.]|nr:MAG: histidine kinase [Geobacter sp.]
MQLHELEEQMGELEIRNAELLQAMKETEKVLQKYSNLFDQAPVGGVITGRDGIIRAVNHVGTQILGGERSDLVGRRLEHFVPYSARSVFTEFFGNMLRGEQIATCEVERSGEVNRAIIHFEGVCTTAEDECRIAMIDITGRKLSPEERVKQNLRLQELSGELARANREHHQEIFRHKKWEEALNVSLSQQRKLASRIMSVREEERTAVAREIHDELGQMLAALQLNVSLMAQEYSDHAQLVARTKAMENLITSSIMTVQRISSELRPVMLDILGLADAIEWQAKEFQKRSGISCKTIILLTEKKQDRDLSTAVYRIFQEALSNVIRHSGATTVQVDLVERKGWLVLTVRDNGRGIAEQEKRDVQSLGIAGMRERAETFGGKLRICGAPQQGTALFVRIPLTGKELLYAHQDSCSR